MSRVLEAPERYRQGTALGLERYSRTAYLENYRTLVRSLAARGRDIAATPG